MNSKDKLWNRTDGVDPVADIRAVRDRPRRMPPFGIVYTPEQIDRLGELIASGDLAGAQRLVLDHLNEVLEQ